VLNDIGAEVIFAQSPVEHPSLNTMRFKTIAEATSYYRETYPP
jgi:hypothetical protein